MARVTERAGSAVGPFIEVTDKDAVRRFEARIKKASGQMAGRKVVLKRAQKNREATASRA